MTSTFMTVEPGEAVAGPWKELLLADLANLLSSDGSDKSVSRPQLVAIDGRGGAGKTFLAERLRAEIPSSAIVHTDDVAWHHSYFDWDEVLIKNVIQPLRANEAVDFRPELWRVRGREGAIVVPAGMSVIWIEGTGSLRRSTLPLLDASVWFKLTETLPNGVFAYAMAQIPSTSISSKDGSVKNDDFSSSSSLGRKRQRSSRVAPSATIPLRTRSP